MFATALKLLQMNNKSKNYVMTFLIQSVIITFQNVKNLHLPLFSGYAIYLTLRSTHFWGVRSLSLIVLTQIMRNG